MNVIHFNNGSEDLVCTHCLHLAIADLADGADYSIALNAPWGDGEQCGWCGRPSEVLVLEEQS